MTASRGRVRRHFPQSPSNGHNPVYLPGRIYSSSELFRIEMALAQMYNEITMRAWSRYYNQADAPVLSYLPQSPVRVLLFIISCAPLLLCQSVPTGDVSTIVTSRQSSNVLYVGTSAGVYRSVDGGLHWNRQGLGSVRSLVLAPEQPDSLYAAGAFGLAKTSDGGQSWTPIRLVGCSYSIAVTPLDPLIVYAGTCGYGIYKSIDSGRTWAAVNSGLPTKLVVWDLLIDPQEPSIIFAATGNGIFKSPDGGQTWNAIAPNLSNFWIFCLAINPADRSVLYAGTNGRGVFKSSDGGLTWSELPSVGRVTVNHLAIDPANPNTLYAATQGRGVLKSADGGEHWAAMNSGLPAAVAAQRVAIDPATPGHLYLGTYGHGLFQSADAGATWAGSDSDIHAMGVNAITIDPSNPTFIFAGTASVGVLKSSDGGATWVGPSGGWPGAGWIRSLAVELGSTGKRMYAADLNYGVFVSNDAGEHWSLSDWPKAWKGPNIPIAIAFHPTHPEIVFAAITDSGVQKSVDSGRTWVPVNNGIEKPAINNIDALVIDSGDPETIYAAGAQAIYRSSDSGQTWTGISLRFRVRALAVSPATSGARVWYAGGIGLFKSNDGGLTWTSIGRGLPSPLLIRALAVDPSDPQTVYAGTEGSGMYKSINGGASWTLLGVAAQTSR
jgi:photosystem II stability/assembly factor-like uncharacterized protein